MNENPPQDNQPPQETQKPFNDPPQQSYPQQPYPQWQPQQQPPTQYPPNYPPGYQPTYPPNYQPPYPPYAPPPPAPPPKKKRGPLLWILVGLGIVLVIVVCSAAMSAALHPSTTNTSVQSTPTAATLSQTAQAILTQDASANNSTPSPSTAVSTVGGTLTWNGLEATLTKVKVGPVDQYSTPKSGYEFVTVHMKLKNTSDTEQTYNQLAFHVKSGTGNITDLDAATYGQGINDLGYGTLTSGGTVEGNIVYQVKIGDHKVMLTWQPNQFTDRAGDNGWLLGL